MGMCGHCKTRKEIARREKLDYWLPCNDHDANGEYKNHGRGASSKWFKLRRQKEIDVK